MENHNRGSRNKNLIDLYFFYKISSFYKFNYTSFTNLEANKNDNVNYEFLHLHIFKFIPLEFKFINLFFTLYIGNFKKKLKSSMFVQIFFYFLKCNYICNYRNKSK